MYSDEEEQVGVCEVKSCLEEGCERGEQCHFILCNVKARSVEEMENINLEIKQLKDILQLNTVKNIKSERLNLLHDSLQLGLNGDYNEINLKLDKLIAMPHNKIYQRLLYYLAKILKAFTYQLRNQYIESKDLLSEITHEVKEDPKLNDQQKHFILLKTQLNSAKYYKSTSTNTVHLMNCMGKIRELEPKMRELLCYQFDLCDLLIVKLETMISLIDMDKDKETKLIVQDCESCITEIRKIIQKDLRLNESNEMVKCFEIICDRYKQSKQQ